MNPAAPLTADAAGNDAWLHELGRLRAARQPGVLVTVAAVRGSAPRAVGTKMTVSATTLAGTLGGGHLELQAIGTARELLSQGQGGMWRRLPLGASLGQCCGGVVELQFEIIPPQASWLAQALALHAADQPFVRLCAPVAPGQATDCWLVSADAVVGAAGPPPPSQRAWARRQLGASALALQPSNQADTPPWLLDAIAPPAPRLVLFGAGHVGRALVRVLQDVPCRITWVDERAAQWPTPMPPAVRAVLSDEPEEEVDRAAPGSSFLVMTHSHALDLRLAERILRRGDFAWFGLIGSATKRRRFEGQLAARGLDAAARARMVCPIGLPGIVGKEPAVIALAVAAQWLQQQAASAGRGDASIAAWPSGAAASEAAASEAAASGAAA